MAARNESVTVRVSPSTLKALRSAKTQISELACNVIMVTDGASTTKSQSR
jgi:hypothetical protein